MSGTIYDDEMTIFQSRKDSLPKNDPPETFPVNQMSPSGDNQPPSVIFSNDINKPPTAQIGNHQIISPNHYNEPKKTGILTSLCICCFGTQQLAKRVNNKNVYIRTTLMELGLYIIYLVVCCIIVYASISPTDFYYTKVLSDLFLDTPFNDQGKTTFRKSADVKDFWKFSETAMLNGLYWEDWYDDSSILRKVQAQDQGILYENRIIGRPRLRQLRVKSKLCPVDHLVRSVNGKCYPPYHPDYEDKREYRKPIPPLTQTAWKYFSEEQLKGRPYWGKLHTYSAAGSYLLLDLKSAPTKLLIENLKQNLWIKRQTRAVFLEFTVYNSNINMFCVVKLAWEFSMTGGVVPSWSIRTVRLFRYFSNFEFYIFACEIIFILFTIYYTVQEIVELVILGIYQYLLDPWSYFDVLVIIISYLCISFSIYRFILVNNEVMPLITGNNTFPDFDFLAFWDYMFNIIIAIALFFVSIKIFKYISFNATMSQLSVTLSRCAKDIGGFAIMFFIVFFSFAQLGYLLFGAQVQDYNTIPNSIFTLLRLILGDFDFQAIETANRVLGPIFFISYVFFVFFVLLNMFLAIINDTYSEVKAETQAQKSEFLVMDYIKKMFTCRRRRESMDQERNVGLVKGKITLAELKKYLQMEKFAETEINVFLAKYELIKDLSLDDEETQAIITKLKNTNYEGRVESSEHRRSSIGERMSAPVALPESEVEQLDNRITTMEGSLTGVLTKMDLIISKIGLKNEGTV